MRVTFTGWLRQQRGRDDPIGDLADDFFGDRTARGIRTTAQLLFHLIRTHACLEARLALRQAAREFRQFERAATRLQVTEGERAA